MALGFSVLALFLVLTGAHLWAVLNFGLALWMWSLERK